MRYNFVWGRGDLEPPTKSALNYIILLQSWSLNSYFHQMTLNKSLQTKKLFCLTRMKLQFFNRNFQHENCKSVTTHFKKNYAL